VLGRLRLGSRRMPQPAAEYSSAISVFFVPRKGARDRKLAYVSKSYDAALVHLHIRLLLQVVHVLHFVFPRNGHRIVVGPPIRSHDLPFDRAREEDLWASQTRYNVDSRKEVLELPLRKQSKH